MPRIIHRANTVCFSIPHQRTEVFSANPKSPQPNRCQLQGILRTSGTERKDEANAKRRWAPAGGCEGQQGSWGIGAELQKGTPYRREVLCLFSAFFSLVGLQFFWIIPVFLILPCPAQISSYSGNLAVTQARNELSFSRQVYSLKPAI